MKNFSSQKPKIKPGNSDLLIHSHLNRRFHIQDKVGGHALTKKKTKQTKTKPQKLNRTPNSTTPETHPHTKKKQGIGKVKLTFDRG